MTTAILASGSATRAAGQRQIRQQQSGSALSARSAGRRVAHHPRRPITTASASPRPSGSDSNNFRRKLSSNGLMGQAARSSLGPEIAVTTSSAEGETSPASELGKSSTKFVAETLLPTRSGKFRVRAYRHKVRQSRRYPPSPEPRSMQV